MVGTKIDPGIGVDTGVAGDVLPQIAVSTAADIEARVAVVIAQLQGCRRFSSPAPGFPGIGVFQTHVGKQAVG